MRAIRLPRTGALLAEALALVVEDLEGHERTLDLRGRVLGTDAGATRLFALRVRRARELGQEGPARARGARARNLRREWQGKPVDRWLEITTPAPRRPVYVGVAQKVYYRSDKHGGRKHSYVHEFDAPRPAVYRASGNYYLVGGAKRVTGKGIEH